MAGLWQICAAGKAAALRFTAAITRHRGDSLQEEILFRSLGSVPSLRRLRHLVDTHLIHEHQDGIASGFDNAQTNLRAAIAKD